MSGLDEILQTITERGIQDADALLKEADAKAKKIRADGETAAEDACAETIAACRAECEKTHRAACAGAEAEQKRKLLRRKNICVDEAIEKALARVDTLPDGDYFGMIQTLLKRYLKKGKAVVYFGERDLARLPSGFAETLQRLADSGGFSITIAKEPADIENGFLLCYGNIQENCSFRAIAEARRDSIRDRAAAVLFK